MYSKGPQGPIKKRRPRKKVPEPIISFEARNSLQRLLSTINSLSPEDLRDPNVIAHLQASFSSTRTESEPIPEPEPVPAPLPVTVSLPVPVSLPAPVSLPVPVPLRGSFEADSLSDHFNKRWSNITEFHAWRALEEKKDGIEILRTKKVDDGFMYETRQYYVCSRHGTGGLKKYTKKHSRNRTIESKRTGCPCSLLIKTYLDTDIVLGHYKERHNHELGNKNLRFTRISKQTRELITEMLRAGISPENILESLHETAAKDSSDDKETNDNPTLPRNLFIRLRDIARIRKEIDAKGTHLH